MCLPAFNSNNIAIAAALAEGGMSSVLSVVSSSLYVTSVWKLSIC